MARDPRRPAGRRLLLLPGTHGSTSLFARFLDSAPHWAECDAVALPSGAFASYRQLAEALGATVARRGPYDVVIGESFSGPLAILLTRLGFVAPELVVLAASFVRAPRARWSLRVGAAVAARLPLPRWALTQYLCGGDRELGGETAAVVRKASRSDVACRLRLMASVELSRDLEELGDRVLCLVADHDRLLGRSARIPAGHSVRLPAAHMVLQTAPLAAWRAIETALGPLPRRPGSV